MGAIEAVTAAMLGMAAFFDAREMRIPNRLQTLAIAAVGAAVWAAEPHSWFWRLLCGLVLCGLFLLSFLLGQSGGGDFKMMLWFGAGLGLDAAGVLAASLLLMGLFLATRLLLRRRAGYVPLAPFLLVGFFVWQGFVKIFL